MARFFFQSVDS